MEDCVHQLLEENIISLKYDSSCTECYMKLYFFKGVLSIVNNDEIRLFKKIPIHMYLTQIAIFIIIGDILSRFCIFK